MTQVYVLVYSVDYETTNTLVSVHATYKSAKAAMDKETSRNLPSDMTYSIISKGVLQ